MAKKKKMGCGQWVTTAFSILFALCCLVPLLLIIVVSFSSDESVANKGFSFFPEEFSLKAWEYVLGYGKQLVVSYGVTIFITVVGTLLSLVIMSMLAYTLTRRDFMLRKIISFILVFTLLFNGGQLSSYFVNTTMYGLKDNIWVLILPSLINVMNVIILRTYINNSITDSLAESAKIDGADELRIFWQIYFPLMKPSLAAVGFMTAVGFWNAWDGAFLYITSPEKTPLQLLLIRIEKNIDFVLNNAGNMSPEEYANLLANMPRETARMALLLATLGPIMVAYPFFQKYFVKGMTIGAVKG